MQPVFAEISNDEHPVTVQVEVDQVAKATTENQTIDL